MTSAATHPYGIKVLLENGAVGRVKQIIEGTTVNMADVHNSDLTINLPINEDQNTEFKSTFRFDLKKFQHTGIRDINKEVEKSISKTIAAFMNSRGGILYIGVDDNGGVVGLEEDYKTLEKPNSDQLRLIIKNSLQGYLKDKVIFEHIKLDFPLTYGKEICRIRVSATQIPIFVHDGGKQECYVRVDNESKPYETKEFLEYWTRRSHKM